MFIIRILYLTILKIIIAVEGILIQEDNCLNVNQTHFGYLKCRTSTIVWIRQIWFGKHPLCVQPSSSLPIDGNSLMQCLDNKYCIVNNNRYQQDETYLNIRFQCIQCNSVLSGITAIATCPITTVVETNFILYSEVHCPVLLPGGGKLINYKTYCENPFSCHFLTHQIPGKIASIYYDCKVGNSMASNATTTQIHISSTVLVGDTTTIVRSGNTTRSNDATTQLHGVPVYVFIVGGTIGVLLIMSIMVGVLLRKRYKTRNIQQPSKENFKTNMTARSDTTQETPEPESNQGATFMSSSDANHVSPSHAVNLEISTDVSNTYSHLRNTVDDSDVLYDLTIRNNVHDTSDGDYGIAHRRITEDDYDVSGNYRQSLSEEADTVYN